MTGVMVGNCFIELFTSLFKYLLQVSMVIKPGGGHVYLFCHLFGSAFPLRHVVILKKHLPVMFDHSRTGGFGNEHGITVIHETFKVFNILFGHILY